MEIRNYEPGDEHAILDLFEIAFKKRMSLEYWNWRYRDNPTLDQPLIYLMWEDEQVVAHYAVSPLKLWRSDLEVMGALSMTTMTHPAYEGRGCFRKLASELYCDALQHHAVEIVYGFPNNLSHRGLIQGLQWKDVEVVTTLVRECRDIDSPVVTTFERVSTFDEGMAAISKELTSNYDLRICRTVEFLDWRLMRNPNQYIVLREPRTSAFLAFKLYRDDQSLSADIVEWAIPNDLTLSEQALAGIIGVIDDSGLSHLSVWMPLDDPRHLTLEKLGFHLGKPLTYMGYRDAKNLSKPGGRPRWYYQMSDSDVF